MTIARMKFEISPLINTMLDQIPIEVWKDPTTTFCDPAMGGGQFIFEIILRLKEMGFKDGEIKPRVSAYEDNLLRVGYVAAKYFDMTGVVIPATLEKKSLDEIKEVTVKYNVVLGNPPFKKANEPGGSGSLWRKFVVRSFEITKENGFVGMVSPVFTFKNGFGRFLTEYQTLSIHTDVAQYFPNVGSSFWTWVVRKTESTQDTRLIDLGRSVNLRTYPFSKFIEDPMSESVLLKIYDVKKRLGVYDCKTDLDYSGTDLKDRPDYQKEKSSTHPFRIRHATKQKFCWVIAPTACHLKRKVMMTFSGYPNFEYFDETNPCSASAQISGYIEVENELEGANLIQNLELKINRFERKVMANGGFTDATYFRHINLGVSKALSDLEAYQILGLTHEEIQHVESMVK